VTGNRALAAEQAANVSCGGRAHSVQIAETEDVRLGTDESWSHVILPDGMGVGPRHAILSPAGRQQPRWMWALLLIVVMMVASSALLLQRIE
jgi:hypothetical protein